MNITCNVCDRVIAPRGTNAEMLAAVESHAAQQDHDVASTYDVPEREDHSGVSWVEVSAETAYGLTQRITPVRVF